MAKTDGGRPGRVGERIRAELMELLLTGAVKDPGVSGAVVHEVIVSNDLRQVREGGVEVFNRLMRGLERASGFLRRELGQRLQIRYTPELKFFWDETTERAQRVEELLEEIRQEDDA